MAEMIILDPSGHSFIRIKLENWRTILLFWLLTPSPLEYLFMSHVLTVSSNADVTRRPDGRWYSTLLTQFECPSKLRTLLFRFLESQRAIVVSSEHVTKILVSRKRTQLTQSPWADRIVFTNRWLRGSKKSKLCFSHAATRRSPLGENSTLKMAPCTSSFGLSSGSQIFLKAKCL